MKTEIAVTAAPTQAFYYDEHGGMPAQFFAERKKQEGARGLAWAVIDNAWEDVQTYHGLQSRRARRLFGEAWEWFLSEDMSWPFSFLPLCEKLGVDAAWLRKGLEQWRARREAAQREEVHV